MPNTKLPRRIEEITPEWLTAVLQERAPGTKVKEIEIVQAIHGTSTKFRIRARYADDIPPGGPPSELCIKGGFDEALRQFDFLKYLYELEGNFYAKLAPKLDVPMIPCWYAAAEDGQGIIVLEDLIAKGATFPKPVTPWQPARVEKALSILAKLHAQTWDAKPEDYPWIYKSWDQIRRTADGCLADNVWADMLARPDAKFLPPEQRNRDRMRRGLEAIAQRMEADTPWCVVHFDATINNTYLEPVTGDPRFCDWQCVSIGPFMLDVPYHIAGALSVADRRQHEEDLFAHYLTRLHAEGGPRFTVEEKWLEYRQYEMGMGWLWCTCSPLMQPKDTIAAMTERHATACADHDTLAALDV